MTLFQFTIGALALIAAAFSLLAVLRLSKRRSARLGSGEGKVLLLRPIDAPTPRELENLAAPIDYPGELEHLVVSPFRPRLPSGVRWAFSDPTCPNRKVGHLVYALATLDTDGRHVLAIDADVAVDGALVKDLVAALESGAELASASPSLIAHDAAGYALESLLGHTHHSFLALDAMSAGAKAVCGKALALGPKAQAELPALVDHIGEDLELAMRLHARGAPVALVHALARVPLAETTFSAVFERMTRWMQVLRAHRPVLYPSVPLLFAPTLPLVGLAVVSGGAFPALAVAFLCASRALLSVRLGQLRGSTGGALGRWIQGELLLLGAFLHSLGRRTVSWRGRTYALSRGGRMTPVSSKRREVGYA